ncbi:uncharacterized protein BP5553_00141 [Venustampulla echinocandica]|uniref:S-adenosyl-L-methionine-dependent methyltransferase n=1 Tax=Venustampulla echinocandica TaxID=2656787 RepID=A0A370TXB7_9HELO|nr:uncharacterized protein BP5553_00141 [Venustampulla echinocandica]RDL40162.1 hypothetical protein BP5553_00141 [Venustampulla echinocandica]
MVEGPHAPVAPAADSATQQPQTESPTERQVERQIEHQTQAQIVALQAATTIEPGTDESDDGYGTDYDSRASTSISSSVRDYAFEHGRRYHQYRAGQYQFPNDEPEQEREDMKHSMVVHLCGGKLHYAPLKNPQQIIDLGTGTGIWAIDMGDEYPSAQVLGTDLSPIQPSFLPPNVRFMVDDAESPWFSAPDSLDFVHARNMCAAIKDWPQLLSQAYTCLKPGGWVEIQDPHYQARCDDGTMNEDYPVAKFFNTVKEGLAVFGVDLLGAKKNADLLRDAGFTNVEEKVFKIPIGVWPRNKTMKLIGLYMRSVIYDGLQAISLGPFTRGLHWTPEEIEVFLISVRKALMNQATHSYVTFHVVYGQKPGES